MGSLKFFNLQELKDRYHLDIFLECGLGWGDGIKYAQTFDFEKIYSIEISQDVINNSKDELCKDKRVEVLCANSVDGIREVLKSIPTNKNILWWTDSHFPSADLGFAAFDAEKNEEVRLPLWNELNLIKELRPNNKDVILLDDCMIFSQTEVFPDEHLKKTHAINTEIYANHLDKIRNLFSETHNSELFYKDSGYLIISPK